MNIIKLVILPLIALAEFTKMCWEANDLITRLDDEDRQTNLKPNEEDYHV